MKVTQSALLSSSQAAEAKKLGAAFARLRIARGMKQDQAALRAGLSRNTAYRLEKGDPGLAVGQNPAQRLPDSAGFDPPRVRGHPFSADTPWFVTGQPAVPPCPVLCRERSLSARKPPPTFS